MVTEGQTLVMVEKTTRNRLQTYRITLYDTYNEIINRMLDFYDQHKVKSEEK